MYYNFLGPKGLQGTHMDILKPKKSKSMTFTVREGFFTFWAILAHSAPLHNSNYIMLTGLNTYNTVHLIYYTYLGGYKITILYRAKSWKGNLDASRDARNSDRISKTHIPFQIGISD